MAPICVKLRLKLALQQGIDGDDQRLDHVVEKMRETNGPEHVEAGRVSVSARDRPRRAPTLLSIAHTLLASSSPVLPECADGPLRALCLPEQAGQPLGRAGVHRRDRPDRVPRRDLPRAVRCRCPSSSRRPCRSIPRTCPNMPPAPRFGCWRRSLLLPGVHLHLCDLGGEERAGGHGCWCRSSTSCSRCRSSVSFRSRSSSSCRWRRGACWAPNSPRSSRSSPARPGTWRSASIKSLRTVPIELIEAARSRSG